MATERDGPGYGSALVQHCPAAQPAAFLRAHPPGIDSWRRGALPARMRGAIPGRSAPVDARLHGTGGSGRAARTTSATATTRAGSQDGAASQDFTDSQDFTAGKAGQSRGDGTTGADGKTGKAGAIVARGEDCGARTTPATGESNAGGGAGRARAGAGRAAGARAGTGIWPGRISGRRACRAGIVSTPGTSCRDSERPATTPGVPAHDTDRPRP